jgi:YHS domain-containing protein
MKGKLKITLILSLTIMVLAATYIGAKEQNKAEKSENPAKAEKQEIKSGSCCASQWGQENGKMMGMEKDAKGEQATCPMGKDCKGKECKGEGCSMHGAKAKPDNPQTQCPVMEGLIDKKYSAEHAGKRVYFCCPGCVHEFKRNPEKYIKQMEDQGIDLEKVTKPQTLCPISGKEINKNFASEHKGRKVYFCSPGCQKEFEKNPEIHMKKMMDQGIEPEKIVKAQTTCPVMGGKISGKHYADYKGQRVYFCCTSCVDMFKKEPEKYLNKLEEQNETPEKLTKLTY